jgi:hypothetical protein
VPGHGFGFAATREATKQGLELALARAVEVARSLPATAAADPLPPVPPARGHWASACEIDPFALSLDERLELLLEAEAPMRGDPRLVRTVAESLATRTVVAFASSDGAACTQSRIECGGGISAYAAAGDELQRRSYPNAHGGSVALAGYEHLTALDLRAHAPRVAEEALALLGAPPCPAGRTTLVLGDEQLALQVHESIGHALELDRILLGEASYAGTSWVTQADIGTLVYGSPLLAISADATLPRRPRIVRLGRRGRGGAAHHADRGRRRPRNAVGPPVGRCDRRRVRRHGPRRRVRPPADREDDQHLARARRRRHARGTDRRRAQRRLHGHEPLVVDRRPAPELPVRHRGRPRDPRRQARPPAAQPDLLRCHADVLALTGRRGERARHGGCGACSTAARGSPARRRTSLTAPHRPVFATSRSEFCGERATPSWRSPSTPFRTSKATRRRQR